MTKSEAHNLTVKQFAALLGVSLSTAYRKMHARKVWGLAAKVNGRYVVKLSVEEVRTWKALLVERERTAARDVADAIAGKFLRDPSWTEDALVAARARYADVEATFVVLGLGDLFIAILAAKNVKSVANLNRVERMIAA